MNLNRKALAPIVALVLVLAVVAAALTTFMGRTAEENATQEAAAGVDEATRVAAVIGAAVADYRRALETLAASPEAFEAVQGTVSPTELASYAAGTLPPHLTVRALDARPRREDDGRHPPVSFGSIDLMRNAGDGSRPLPVEYYSAAAGDDGAVTAWFVVLAPVRAVDGALAGFLHLAVDARQLDGVLERAAGEAGLTGPVLVEQIVPGAKGPTVAQLGTLTDHTNVPAAVIPGTAWRVLVPLPSQVVAPAGDHGAPALPLPLIGGAVVLVLALGLALGRRRKTGAKAPEAPMDHKEGLRLGGAIDSIFKGEYPGMEPLVREAIVNPADFNDPPEAPAAEQPAAAAASPAPDTHANEVTPVTEPTAPTAVDDNAPVALHPSIFRTYDIRGIVGETLDEQTVYRVGRALGAMAAALGEERFAVGRDGRLSSAGFADAMIRGLTESGRDVLDIGLVPSPVLYFATHYLDARSGVMITGSHNPGNYNGIKIVLGGRTLSGDDIQEIRRRAEEADFIAGAGSVQPVEIVADYVRRVSEEIPVSLGRSLKIVVDCGNGVPGIVAPQLLRAIGHDVEELYCDVDGHFPNHHPDPSQPENVADLIAAVQASDADLGLAFDGDGDRLGVVDRKGNLIFPDRQMILFARDVLSRVPGAPIIFDVKCTGRLAAAIREAGGEPIMYKTGHSLIKAKMIEIGAPLAGEMSGHIFFKERWYGFDDALYSACRLLEIIVNSGKSATEVLGDLPDGVSTPELRLDMVETEHAGFMQKVMAAAQFDDATVTTIDGLRVDWPDGWGLIRPSNTTPCLVLRFEGDDEAALASVKERFRALLTGIDASLSLPF